MSIAVPWPWRWGLGRRRRDRPDPAGPRSADAGAVTDARFGGDDDRSGRWVTVYVAATLEEGHVIRGALEAEGIPAVLRFETLSRLYGVMAFGGVEVQVPRALEDRARGVLEEG